jgi:hypothetical protein
LASEEPAESGWAKAALLTLSDSVRASLEHDKSLGPDAEELGNFLATTLRDEERRMPPFELDTIEYARLDRLLSDIIDHFIDMRSLAKSAYELPLKVRIDAKNAKKLRTSWERRFRANYFRFDERRLKTLIDRGLLRDISFGNKITYDMGTLQSRGSSPISDTESSLQFEAGQ